MEQSSSFVQHQPFQLYLLRWEFQLDKLHHNDGERMQEQKGEEISVAKSQFTAMNLSSHVPTSSSSAKSPIASKSLGILTDTGKLASRMRRNSKSDPAGCTPWRVNGHSHGETCRFKRGIRGCGQFRIWNWEWRRCDRKTVCLWNSCRETLCIQ